MMRSVVYALTISFCMHAAMGARVNVKRVVSLEMQDDDGSLQEQNIVEGQASKNLKCICTMGPCHQGEVGDDQKLAVNRWYDNAGRCCKNRDEDAPTWTQMKDVATDWYFGDKWESNAAFACDLETSTVSALPASACPGGIGFITDIEGDLDWFERIVSISKVLKWSGQPTKGMPGEKLILNKGACFVFGGDLFDRGPGDLRLADSLVRLKEDNPDYVFLLAANRDLNKLRLASELSPACLAMPANKCTRAIYEQSKADSDELVNSPELVDRVKWILKYTLSAGKSFEERRKELFALYERSGEHRVDDLDVARNFLAEVKPGAGRIFRFLEKCQLGVRIGETLFVPGSVAPDSLLFVPSLDLRYTDKNGRAEDVLGKYLPAGSSLDHWLVQLNEFFRDAMAAYKKKPSWDTPLEPFGGEALVCYQSPACVVDRAVVTESLYNRGTVSPWGKSAHYDVGIAEFLLQNGIKTFCTGGKPTGHMPLVTAVEGILVIMADTSYSDDSFHEVFIQPDGDFLVHGQLHSDTEKGTGYSFDSTDLKEGLIGRSELIDDRGRRHGWWVQGKTDKGYHLFKQEGRNREYKFVNSSREVEEVWLQNQNRHCKLVSFVTDIEGDLEWFENIVSISEVLKWEGEKEYGMPGKRLAFKQSDSCFVFGGDLFDRGPGDIRLASLFTRFKIDHPDRVFLLLANRDLNKLRLPSELSHICLKNEASICTLSSYNEKPALADDAGKENNLAVRLKWLLKHTLSAKDAFKNRGKELAVLENRKESDVTDEEIAQNYRKELMPPNGAMFRYMQQAQLGVRIGSSLYVPGAITPESLGYVPNASMRYTDKTKLTDASEHWGTFVDLSDPNALEIWLYKVNLFKEEALKKYVEKPVWTMPGSEFGGESLVCYQSPGCISDRSFVTSSLYNRGTVKKSWGTHERNGEEIPIQPFLEKQGIKNTPTGGKPTGHMPLATKVEGIQVIMADTSYSDDSFHEVLMEGDKFRVHGELHDGKDMRGIKVDFSSDTPFIGEQTDDGWWIQGDTDEGYHLFKQEGRVFSYLLGDEAMAKMKTEQD